MAKPGRNDVCPCGSGKKFKHCCLLKQTRGASSSQETLQRAVALHRQGHLERASALYQEVLRGDPNNADALHLLGLTADQQGRLEDATELIRQAIALNSDSADFRDSLGQALQRLGRLEEAGESYREALRLRPDGAEIHSRLGAVLQQQGDVPLAIASYREALQLMPNFVVARFNLGTALQELARFDEAATQYREVLRLQPRYPEAHNNLGNVLRSQGDLVRAIAEYREALRLRPGYLVALNNLGTALVEQGDLTEAAIQFQEALQVKPEDPEVHVNLAKVLQQLGNLPGAIGHYQAALQWTPDNAEIHNNLGAGLHDLGHVPKAIEQYRETLRIKPAYPEAHHNLAIALQDAGDDPGAVEHFREAVRLRPDYALALGNLVYRLEHLCDWADIDALWEHTRNLLRLDPSSSIAPFTAASMPSSPAEQLQWAQNWTATRLGHMGRLRDELGSTFGSGPRHRLRIGYLSTDYHEHAVAYLVAELFELHDRNRFEVIAYSIGRDDISPLRQRLAAGCDRFEDLRALSAVAAAEQIYHDEIDILIDLNGYTHGCRTEILALKPAPVQVNFLGYPGTMGADFIDYIVTDRFVTPPEQQVFFSEQFEYLPDTYLVNDRKRPIAERSPTRTECGLPEAGFVFCCFNSNYKLNAQIFDIWMRLLQAISGSVLWLRESHAWAATNLRREAENRGVDSKRLIFAEKQGLPEHLARQRLADLFLDTLPYNAHATASDALWAGLPVLTCAGETFAGRVAGSLLRAIGLPELITTSLEEYEAKALWLAQHPEEIHALKAKLTVNRETMPLFDTERYTRNLEAAYERMWDTFVASSETEAKLTV
jgi:protein O-GlcNAc transferase